MISKNQRDGYVKEYKVIYEKGNRNPKIGVEQFESRLNELAAENWEFRFISGTYIIFEREK